MPLAGITLNQRVRIPVALRLHLDSAQATWKNRILTSHNRMTTAYSISMVKIESSCHLKRKSAQIKCVGEQLTISSRSEEALHSNLSWDPRSFLVLAHVGSNFASQPSVPPLQSNQNFNRLGRQTNLRRIRLNGEIVFESKLFWSRVSV